MRFRDRLATALLLLSFCAFPARAQYTIVTGSVTDANSVPYAGAQLTAQLVLNGSVAVTGQPTVTVSSQAQCTAGGWGTAPCQVPFPGTFGTVQLGPAGNIQGGGIQLPSNTLVTPAGTQWLFTVTTTGNPPPLGTGPQTCSTTQTVSGSTQTVNISGCPILSSLSSGVIPPVSALPSLPCVNNSVVNLTTGNQGIYTCIDGVYVGPATASVAAWKKVGPVILGAGTAASYVQEPSVFITPVPQVITTDNPTGAPVLGMFYTLGLVASPSLVYAESLDGVNWYPSATISIANHGHASARVISGTIYITAYNFTSTAIDLYSGANAGSMSLVKAGIITAPNWGTGAIGDSGIWLDLNGNWYVIYDGAYTSPVTYYSTGIATCTTPSGTMTCTNYSGNPVINNNTLHGTIADAKSIRQLSASSYIAWMHGTPAGITGLVPSDGFFVTASSPTGPWTVSTNSPLYRTTQQEGLNISTGQIADFSPITINNQCFMYYGANYSQSLFLNSINLAIADLPCEQMANVPQGLAEPPKTLGLAGFAIPQRGQASSVSMTTTTYVGVSSLTLTPGTWLVQGNTQYTSASSLIFTFLQTGVTPNFAAFLSTSSYPEANWIYGPIATAGFSPPNGETWTGDTGIYTYTCTTLAGCTIYLYAYAVFSTGSLSVSGTITGVRIY